MSRWWMPVFSAIAACGFTAEGTGESDPSASGSSSGAATTGSPTATSATPTTDSGSDSGSESSTTANPTSTTGDSTTGDDASTSTGGGTSTDGSTSAGATSGAGSTSTGSPEVCHPVIAEAFVSVSGSDPGREWVVLYNPCPDAVDLGDYAVGWGAGQFDGAVDLVGSVAAGQCFVIGGPDSDAGNFMPVYDQASEFSPQLFISFGGVGLYELPSGSVSTASVPVDLLVWGMMNNAGWTDEEGNVAAVDNAAWPADVSLRRTGMTMWEQADPPTPNGCPTFGL